MGTDDAYAELGLAAGATDHEIKAAWRRLVSQWHPDRNASPQAVLRMQRINLAFEVLRQGVEAEARHSPPPAPPSRPRKNAAPEPPPAPARPPWRIQRKLKLTLEQGAAGGRTVLRGLHTERCVACEGLGYRHSPRPCETCHGAGRVARRGWFGWVAGFDSCGTCHGDGLARLECEACKGQGHLGRCRYEIAVDLPTGLRDGEVLDLLAGGAHGDRLKLHVALREHPLFRLEPDGTLHCEMPVDGFLWMANRWIDVPTLDGTQQLRLDRRHLRYRLRGLGYPKERGGERAHYIVDVKPVFPAQFTREQEQLIERLAASQQHPPGSPLHEWQRRVGAWRGR
ncbi:DnaJ domain-containing protein [Azohydromonas caseinilytica]|uniref:DnaJ domain-containing protein n=1 Tax=Azohydromonas caseinilytica TaxID=2728836 RepID=A0A848FB49_9BURK|nr:DnaJ domain-containing protein [Azohydromonas caseinilytica]NML15669.1 DnaJ domain-containing protein [Azohydromonas caseinilytica]